MVEKHEKEDDFIKAGNKLFGCLAQFILAGVLVGNIIGYIMSERYRCSVSLGKFIVSIVVWTGLTAAFWWMMRDSKGS